MAKRGRKDAYEEKIKPLLPSIMEMCRTKTDRQIAEEIGVSYSTFNKYKKEKTELKEAIKRGRENLVAELKSTLIKKAFGYMSEEVKTVKEEIEYPKELYDRLTAAGFEEDELKQARIVKTEIRKKPVAPDVAALNLLLKNYDKENWANDPQVIELRKKELELHERKLENSEW